jgi:hypothetical protein
MSVAELRHRVERLGPGAPSSRLCDAMMGMAEPDRTFLAVAISAILELDDRVNALGPTSASLALRPQGPRRNQLPDPPSTASPTSESICEDGAPEKLARGIYERLRNGRSGLIWAVHWPDLPPEISQRWVEAVAGALADQADQASKS